MHAQMMRYDLSIMRPFHTLMYNTQEKLNCVTIGTVCVFVRVCTCVRERLCVWCARVRMSKQSLLSLLAIINGIQLPNLILNTLAFMTDQFNRHHTFQIDVDKIKKSFKENICHIL
jgi:hypothetical protein